MLHLHFGFSRCPVGHLQAKWTWRNLPPHHHLCGFRAMGEMKQQNDVNEAEAIKSKVESIRHWRLTRLGKKARHWGFDFIVMTYNILCQDAVNRHRYLYKRSRPMFLEEGYRISRILPEIFESKSDVVCLQEVDQQLYDDKIRGEFTSGGFESVFKKRTGGKPDGVAIFWRTAKFDLVKHTAVEFHSPGTEMLNRDNVGLIAVLKPKHPDAEGMHLHVATTHLLFNPRRGDIKLCQLRLLLDELDRMALISEQDGWRRYHPVILCGDFNVEPHSPLYAFIEQGNIQVYNALSGNLSGQAEGKNKGQPVNADRLSLEHLGIKDIVFPESVDGPESKKLRHSNSCPDLSSPDGEDQSEVSEPSESVKGQSLFHRLLFVPSYKFHQGRANLPFTSMTGSGPCTVDHIFYSVKHKFESTSHQGPLKLIGTYTLMRREDVEDIGGLPNAYHGSDHICLMAKFIIKK